MNIKIHETNFDYLVQLGIKTHTSDGYPILYYLISVDNVTIGNIVYNLYIETKREKTLGKHVLYIRGIIIDESHRRQGIGSKVIKLLIKTIKDNNTSKTRKMLSIKIHSIQLEAQDSELFWHKQGFIKTGEVSKDNWPRMIYIIR